MELFFLDSAIPAEVERAASSALVSGVTTNPELMRMAAPNADPIAHMLTLFDLFPSGSIFHQVHAANPEDGRRQVEELLLQVDDAGGRLVFKLPAQPDWFSFGARLVHEGHRVAFTAVYQPGQFLAATQAGASYAIPYVDRAGRLRPESQDVVAQLSAFSNPGSPLILAASIKSADQALLAFRNGAHGITASWQVLQDLMTDELTDSAVDQFKRSVPF